METVMDIPVEATEIPFSVPDEITKAEDLGTTPESDVPTDQEEFDTLVQSAREFGRQYGQPHFRAEANFKEAFVASVDDFIRLREMFPPKGSRSTRTVAGVEYNWAAFCQTFLYISANYFARLVRELRPDPNPTDPPVPRPIEDTPAYRAGFRAGQTAAVGELGEEAEDESEELVAETEDVEDSDVPMAAESSQTNLTDAVSHFATYKKDALKFAEELRALVRHFGLTRKINVELI